MKWWYENEEEEMKLYKNEDLCIECKNEFFSKPYDHRDPTPGQLGYCIKCDNFLIKERKMEFDKTRVYTALNADELRAGDKVIVGITIAEIRDFIEEKVGSMKCYAEILKILPDNCEERFCIGENDAVGEMCFPLVYLVERARNCCNCGEGKWDAEHQKILCNPAMCGNDHVVFRNHEIEVCEYWKPKTEQKAEPHYRPFKDTDELIKVWGEKEKKVWGYNWLDNKQPMPLIWVKRKECNCKGQLITKFSDPSWVIMSTEGYNMTDLFVHFTFLDGSPCGVEE